MLRIRIRWMRLFWASWIRIRIQIPQSEVRIRILLSSSKNSRKNLDSYCFQVFCYFFMTLSLKNDVNVPSKCKKQKNLEKQFAVGVWKVNTKIAGAGAGSISQRHGSAGPDPDPYRTKLSWIGNTGKNFNFYGGRALIPDRDIKLDPDSLGCQTLCMCKNDPTREAAHLRGCAAGT